MKTHAHNAFVSISILFALGCAPISVGFAQGSELPFKLLDVLPKDKSSVDVMAFFSHRG